MVRTHRKSLPCAVGLGGEDAAYHHRHIHANDYLPPSYLSSHITAERSPSPSAHPLTAVNLRDIPKLFIVHYHTLLVILIPLRLVTIRFFHRHPSALVYPIALHLLRQYALLVYISIYRTCDVKAFFLSMHSTTTLQVTEYRPSCDRRSSYGLGGTYRGAGTVSMSHADVCR